MPPHDRLSSTQQRLATGARVAGCSRCRALGRIAVDLSATCLVRLRQAKEGAGYHWLPWACVQRQGLTWREWSCCAAYGVKSWLPQGSLSTLANPSTGREPALLGGKAMSCGKSSLACGPAIPAYDVCSCSLLMGFYEYGKGAGDDRKNFRISQIMPSSPLKKPP